MTDFLELLSELELLSSLYIGTGTVTSLSHHTQMVVVEGWWGRGRGVDARDVGLALGLGLGLGLDRRLGVAEKKVGVKGTLYSAFP